MFGKISISLSVHRSRLLNQISSQRDCFYLLSILYSGYLKKKMLPGLMLHAQSFPIKEMDASKH